MAVEKLLVSSSLRLTLEAGLDDKGDPVFVNRNYNRLKPTAADEGAYLVAVQLAGLQVYPLAWIHRNDQSQLADLG
jgi:hypothetical protein